MTGTLSLREAALAAIATRLVAELPDVTVERARRSQVDTDTEPMPRLVLTGEDTQADTSVEFGATHYTIGFWISGFVSSATDLGAEQGLSHLHARVVDALVRWTPDEDGLTDPSEGETTFTLFEADQSAKPAGMFAARFSLLAIGPTGGPWST